MRRFAIGTMLVLGLSVAGCDKPIEGIPSSGGSGVSAGDDLSVEMPVEDAAPPPSDILPPADAPTAAPSADTTPPPADVPADAPPATEPPKVEDPAPAVEEPKQSSTDKPAKAGKLVSATLKVPTMMCPHGCWPTVKETLTAQPGVDSVVLAKQSSADAIDNPTVLVKLNGKFDSQAAVAALAKAGFENAEIVN